MEMDTLRRQLLHAYLDARKHKRNTVNQLEFERDLESNLLSLAHDLQERRYVLRPSICFIHEKPVKREIVAAHFRDRVVHHLLYSWIYPLCDRSFIYDSYSCRVGKGTLFGIERAKKFIVAENRDFTRECFVLRLDVTGFFMAIRRDILYRQVVELLRCHRWEGIPDRGLCIYLLKKFIFANPLESAKYKSPPSAWDDLPRNKSLKYAAPDCGLPFGNLTSQLFGNVYMNPLDHFVKQNLKVRHYGRYVDDLLLVHHDRRFLLSAIERIRIFMKERLFLILNEKKTKLQSVEKGFDFLGAFALPYRTYPGRRIVANFKECLRRSASFNGQSRIVSYCGLLGHFDAFGMQRKLARIWNKALL